jgi:hypothetical protein
VGIALGAIAAIGPALAAAAPSPHSPAHHIYTNPQPPSKADFSGHGANKHGPYDSTRNGAPSMNGNGKGKAVGKPCAGCVGKADNKNPKGQMPNGSDRNAGYECDRNHGIGRTNPAHTGCQAATSPPPPGGSSTPPPPPPGGSSTPPPPPPGGSSTPPPPPPGGSSTPPPAGGSSTPPPGGSFGPPPGSAPPPVGKTGPPSHALHSVPSQPTTPPTSLSSTGAPIGRTVLAAMALIVIGGGLLLTGRRRPGRRAH